MNELIGSIAGQIWSYLEEHGQVTTLKLKSALGISNSMLYLGLGWLCREDKIEIVESGNTYKAALKK